MRSIIFIGLCCLIGLQPGIAQEHDLRACLAAAEAAHPLQAQRALIQQSARLSQERLGSQWLPGISLQGQAAYQSDVITFPEIGGNAFPEIPQFQYQLNLELNQALYDGGQIQAAKAIAAEESAVSLHQQAVNIYQIREGVANLYFGTLAREEQLRLMGQTQKELEDRRQVLVDRVAAGAMTPEGLLAFDRELLKLRSEIAELKARVLAQRKLLTQWTGDVSWLTAPLELPALESLTEPSTTRPELALIESQQSLLQARSQALKASLRPRLSAFARAGLGQPNPFNFLQTDLDGFYQLGVRLAWSPWDWGRTQKQREIIGLQRRSLDAQADFLQWQFELQGTQAAVEAEAKSEAAKLDSDRVAVQQDMLARVRAQWEAGLRTTDDYLAEEHTLNRLHIEQALRRISQTQALVQQGIRTGTF